MLVPIPPSRTCPSGHWLALNTIIFRSPQTPKSKGTYFLCTSLALKKSIYSWNFNFQLCWWALPLCLILCTYTVTLVVPTKHNGTKHHFHFKRCGWGVPNACAGRAPSIFLLLAQHKNCFWLSNKCFCLHRPWALCRVVYLSCFRRLAYRLILPALPYTG